MRVLVVGGGGREHSLAWALARSPSVDEVFSAPGNPGMAELGEVVDIAADDREKLAAFASERGIDLTVVGPEAPLVAGIADLFSERGLRVFGPSAAAARIEGSKVFCRAFAARHGIPMAAGESFDDPEAAASFARSTGPPVVVKADGLAAGKGVFVCADHDEARRAIERIMVDRAFGDAGGHVVVEECLIGRETSIFCLTDGEGTVILEPAQDYKRALDGGAGLNTGGMGAYSPVPWLDAEVRERAVREIVEPVVRGLADEGRRYAGCLYTGLMVTESGPKLIEVNCRFGDPECQVLLPRLTSDLAEVMVACADGELGSPTLGWTDEACVCVVVASGGYPGSYRKGLEIGGIPDAEALEGVVVFQAGTAFEGDRLVTASGRVLNVVATGGSLPAARDRAYEGVGKIRLESLHHRTDIAKEVS